MSNKSLDCCKAAAFSTVVDLLPPLPVAESTLRLGVPGEVLAADPGASRLREGGPGVPAGDPGPALAVPGQKSQSPACITGDKLTKAENGVVSPHPLTIKIDWIQGTASISRLEEIKQLVSGHLGTPELREKGIGFVQDGQFRWASGAFLAWDNAAGIIWLVLNGDSVDLIGSTWWPMFFDQLERAGLKGTRVDIALDIHDRRISLDEVRAAAEAGNFTGYRRMKCDRPMKLLGSRMVKEGDQVSFGRRGKEGKGCYVRVYDKGLESKGQIDAVRLEAEYSGELAEQVFRFLADEGSDSSERFARQMRRLLASSIDFVERGNHVHRARMKRLSWWADLVTLLGEPIRVVCNRVIPPLHRSMQWVRDQAGTTLALAKIVCQSMGVDFAQFILQLVDHAETRISWTRQGVRQLGFNPASILAGD